MWVRISNLKKVELEPNFNLSLNWDVMSVNENVKPVSTIDASILTLPDDTPKEVVKAFVNVKGDYFYANGDNSIIYMNTLA